MKSLDRQQLVLSGFGLLILLVAGWLGWQGLGSLASSQDRVQELAQKLGNEAIAGVLANPDGVDKTLREAKELMKLKNQLDESCQKATQVWKRSTAQATAEGQEWSQDPGKWKDQLISIQSKIQKDAVSSRLLLSPEFYLGLEAFRQKSPAVEEVPELALDLCLAQRLTEKLMESRREARDQYPTPCELRLINFPHLEPAVPGATQATARPKETAGNSSRKTVRLEISCSPEVLYDYVHRLNSDDWLWIIRDLAITNPRQTFPARSEIAKTFAPGGNGAASSSRAKLLEVLAGGETVVVQMEVDYVPWKEKNITGKPVSTEKKP